MTRFQSLMLLCGATTLALGCSHTPEPREPSAARNQEQVAMTPASRTRSATEQIAEARCQRERQCGNVGDDKTFSSSQDCLARIQSDWKDDLNSRQCPGGINQEQLDECLVEVRSEDCNNPFDTLARLTECTKSQICIEEP